MPYGPGPRGAATGVMTVPGGVLTGSSRPTIPFWPVNQTTPSGSMVAVLRLAFGPASGQTAISRVSASTRTIAFNPVSVTHAAPSGATTTPCGEEPSPRGIVSMAPDTGSSNPSAPARWAVYQICRSSAAGATSCGCSPGKTGKLNAARHDSGGVSASGVAWARTVLVTTGARKKPTRSAARARIGNPFEQTLVTAPLSLGAQRSVTMVPAIGRVIGDES